MFFNQFEIKKDLHRIKWLLDEIMADSPTFAGEEEFLKEPVVKTYLGGITYVDEQWVIPSYEFALTYLELICKKPAFIVPHLWSPEMVQFCSSEFFGKPVDLKWYRPSYP